MTNREAVHGDGDGGLVVIANREPYAHERTDSGVIVQRPASGLVTGLEPMLKASGGTWIGYGGGSADRECSPLKITVLLRNGSSPFQMNGSCSGSAPTFSGTQ